MMALAAYPLGLRCVFLDRNANSPGGQVAPILLGDLDDPARLRELAASSDVLTFDWENLSSAALQPLQTLTTIHPSPMALALSQDRLHEKDLFSRLKIPVAAHSAVDGKQDLVRAVGELGAPGVLKTRRLGYDGKGQYVIEDSAHIEAAWTRMGGDGLIYEKFQEFSQELSLIGARSATGEIVFYPLCANFHVGGVLRHTIAPVVEPVLERMARRYLKKLMETLQYVGVLAVEFFVVGGRLIVNEMAPRVHNSGHWTIEGCVTSQFENHLRAICGLPLGSTRPLGHAAMINFLGLMPERTALLAIDGLAYHDYGKEPRPGRKLGHCTIVRTTSAERNSTLRKTLKLIAAA